MEGWGDLNLGWKSEDTKREEVEARRRKDGGVKGRKKLKVGNCSFRRLDGRLKGIGEA
jgi:hypothetical protein